MRIKTETGIINEKSVQLLEINGEYYLQLIDQRLLPHQLKLIKTKNVDEAVTWITDMAVRGAPAIGATGAYCVVLGLQELDPISDEDIEQLKNKIIAARPTAKDLDTFVTKTVNYYQTHQSLEELAMYAKQLAYESEEECRLIGEVASHLITADTGILTHCNAGALATVDWGTALAPMRVAHRNGVPFTVFVDETRPRLQGMLTAWELENEGIDHHIIVDNAAGFFMQQGQIQLVITGTDRVLKDGTVTNKIGTYEKAVVANRLGIPFYIALPWSTFDPDLESASDIPIEYRSEEEVTHVTTKTGPTIVSPTNSKALNPAFDITPADLITGYITKDGIFTHDELLDQFTMHNA